MNLLNNNWVDSKFEDDEDRLEFLRKKADAARPLLELLIEWAEKEKATIDSGLKVANLKDKPDRAELALIGVAQKEVLDNLIKNLDN